jgi:hypothetical protein
MEYEHIFIYLISCALEEKWLGEHCLRPTKVTQTHNDTVTHCGKMAQNLGSSPFLLTLLFQAQPMGLEVAVQTENSARFGARHPSSSSKLATSCYMTSRDESHHA